MYKLSVITCITGIQEGANSRWTVVCPKSASVQGQQLIVLIR